MQTTTQLTQLGNSDAFIVPAPLIREAKYKRGQKFTIDYIPQTNGMFVRPASIVKKSIKRSDQEFQTWLDGFLKEDGELLDQLA